MYDALTIRVHLLVPAARRDARCACRASARLDRLPGAQHPAVYRVEFACGCGAEHPGLVTHDDLDWAPLGLADETTFLNLMTSRLDSRRRRARRPGRCADQGGGVAVELLLLARGAAAAGVPVGVPAARADGAGRSRRARGALPGLRQGLREPRHARARRRAVRERPRGGGGRAPVRRATPTRCCDEFHEELYSASFDARRLALQ